MAASFRDSGSSGTSGDSKDPLGRAFVFEDFELRAGSCELLRSDRPTDLQLKPTRLLLYLIDNRDRVVPKTELLDQVWPDANVSESAFTTAVGEIRRVLDDHGATQRLIRTSRGRGYQFVADVNELVRGPEGVPPFVGRGATLTVLREALETAQGGRGQIVLLTGEPGIGKTRTAEELVAIARSRVLATSVARCFEGDGAPPYWPWTQILRGLIEGRTADTLRAEMGTGAADIARPSLCRLALASSSGVPGPGNRWGTHSARGNLPRRGGPSEPSANSDPLRAGPLRRLPTDPARGTTPGGGSRPRLRSDWDGALSDADS